MQPGSVFAGYTIERVLGQGGMGVVYLARHPRLPRQVALKLLNRELAADPQAQARFEREAELVAQLDHPNIVTVYDRGTDDGHPWIAMQFIDGTDAADLGTPLPLAVALDILSQTAKALDFAHRRGVVHRDVKPANILLTNDDGERRVLLTDFGIARMRNDAARLTRTGTFAATFAYASPEQLAGSEPGPASDQYSLACTLFALLTGRPPYPSDNPATVITGHLHEPVPQLSAARSGLPAELGLVLAKALAKSPEDRYASCGEFAAACDLIANTVADIGHSRTSRTQVAPAAQTQVAPPGYMPDQQAPSHRSRGLLTALLIAALVLTIPAALLFWGYLRSDRTPASEWAARASASAASSSARNAAATSTARAAAASSVMNQPGIPRIGDCLTSEISAKPAAPSPTSTWGPKTARPTADRDTYFRGKVVSCADPAGANKITSVGEQYSTTCPPLYGTYTSNGLRFCAMPNLAERHCYRGSSGDMRQLQTEYSLCPFHYVLKRLTNSVGKDDCKDVPSASYDASFTLASDKITYCMRR